MLQRANRPFMKPVWRSLFDVLPGEGQVVFLLVAHSLFMGFSLIVFETAASALFLARFPAECVPYTFIGTAFVVPLSGVVYNSLRNRLSTARLWTGTLLFLLAVPLAAVAVLHATDSAWPSFVLMTFVIAMYALAALEFWSVAGRVLSLRQARRLYGLIGSGEVAAGILGGLAVAPMLKFVSVINLLLVVPAGFFVCLVCLFGLLRIQHRRTGEAEEEEEEDKADTGRQSVAGLLRAVAKDHYILLIVGLFVFYNLTRDTLEYTTLSQIQAYFRQNESLVAGFIGAMLSVREIVTLVARTFLSGRLLSRFGLGAGLAATPALMMAGSVSLVAVSLALPNLSLFWLVVFLKIAEGTARNSLFKPATMMAYRPLAPQRRDRAQMLIETAIEPISVGLTGAILLVLNFTLAGAPPGHKAIAAGGLMLATSCAWMAMGRLLRLGYMDVVMKALRRGSLRGEVLTLDDAASALLTNQLRFTQPREALYLLKVMHENMEPARFAPLLPGQLGHPEPDVRAAVARCMEQLRLHSFRPALEKQLENESAPMVRVSILCALGSTGDPATIRSLSPLLHDPSLAIRVSALGGLLKYGGDAEAPRTREQLAALVEASDPEERLMAAGLLRDVASAGLYRSLRPLLEDANISVRAVAMEAAGQLKDAALWPEIAEQLAVPQIWQHAARALALGGDSAIPALEAIIRRSDAGLTAGRRAVRVLGRIGTPRAIAALRPLLEHPELRQPAARSLQDCGYRAHDYEAEEIDSAFRREGERIAGVIAALVDMGGDDDTAVLRQTLRGEIARSQDILFSMLAFLYDPDSMRKARTYWRSGSAEKKAFALEVLDNLCERRHKMIMMPLLEGLSAEDMWRKLNGHFPQPLRGKEAQLKGIVNTSPSWATHWVRVWAARALREHGPESERSGMLSTIEKVLLLKSVEFFLTTDDDVLVELAALANEVSVKAGGRIVEKGKVESTMYLIASGRVQVQEGGETLAELGRGSVFGELAALDSQPRTADVTALSDVLLLRIDHATLVDLMAEHIEVAHGIIRFLIRRYRPPTKTAHG
jgi:HEAT repeat protein